MKKIIKNPMFTFVIGIIISSTVLVGASYLYHANEVSYKNTTVEAAINNLYDITDLSSRIATLEEKQTWKKLSTITNVGSGVWTMPDDWTEAYVLVNMNGQASYTFFILKDSILNYPNVINIHEGFNNTSSNVAYLSCYKEKIVLSGIALNGTSLTTVSSATLYYR